MANNKLDVIEKTKILTSNRKKSRKLLFQELYAMSINEFDSELFMESFFDDVFTFNQDEQYINEMIRIIPFQEAFFINILKIYTPKFKVENMSLSYILPIYI
jgi:transcription termination factor NusB